jgi:hypothetical protein
VRQFLDGEGAPNVIVTRCGVGSLLRGGDIARIAFDKADSGQANEDRAAGADMPLRYGPSSTIRAGSG